jgi:hypothetical protein
MTIKTRLAKLEEKIQPAKVFMTVTQDLENPDLYHQNKPGHYSMLNQDDVLKTWTRAELDTLPSNYEVFCIMWIHTPYPQEAAQDDLEN